MRPSPSALIIWRWCPSPIAAHISLASGAGNLQAIYGSTFFMATGFHGAHVIIGTIFLTVCLARAIAGQFTPTRHFGFEAAAWYWHFVDVVWLFLFACIYVWGAGPARSIAGGSSGQATFREAITGPLSAVRAGAFVRRLYRHQRNPARPAAWTMRCSMPATGRRCSAY